MKSKTMTGKTLKSGRMANLELLRCVAMMMVVVLHFLGKGYLHRGGQCLYAYQRLFSQRFLL